MRRLVLTMVCLAMIVAPAKTASASTTTPLSENVTYTALPVPLVSNADIPLPGPPSVPSLRSWAQQMERWATNPCVGFHLVGAGLVKSGNPIGFGGSYHDSECAAFNAIPPTGFVISGGFAISSCPTPSPVCPNAIFATYSASAATPDLMGNVYPTGSFTIDGGTGIYANATGGGTFNATASVVTFQASADFSGTITY